MKPTAETEPAPVANADALRGDGTPSADTAALLAALPGHPWITDAAGRCTWIGPQWERFSGLRRPEILGHGWLEAIVPEDRGPAMAAWQSIVAGRQPFSIDFRMHRHDGAVRRVRLSGAPITAADGGVVGWIGLNVDLDAEHPGREVGGGDEVAEARLDADAVFPAIADIVDGLVWAFDARARRMLLLGSRDRQFAGWPLTDIDGAYQRWFAAVEPEDQPIAANGIATALATGQSTTDYRMRAPDGSVRWIRNRAIRATSDGVVAAVSTDITEEKLSATVLARSEAQFRGLVESLPHVVWAAGPDGRLSYVGPRWAEISETPDAAALSRDVVDELVGSEDRERARASFDEAMRGGGPMSMIVRSRRVAPEERWFEIRAVPVRDASGDIEGWIGTAVDVHDLKTSSDRLVRSEQQLREADRRKDEFIAMLGHELRNPLAPIRDAAVLLETLCRRDPDPRATRAAGLIARQANHLSRLVDDLLEVSRITQGEIELDLDEIDLEGAIIESIEATRGAIEAKDQIVSLQSPRGAVTLSGDRTRLVQVFCNLLSNASRYSGDQARIRISAAIEGEAVVVRVADDGIGIPREIQGRIFELFFREERAGGRPTGGLGMGLPLARQLVELHGGTISLHSDGHGRGSEFTVRLPLARRAAVPRPSPAAEGPAPPLRILLVEDNADAAEATRMLLEFDGHDVRVAGDGLSGVRAANEARPDLALIDLGLPEIDGLEVARRIRRLPGLEVLPLVALTGFGSGNDEREALAAGFDAHMAKPADPARLRAILARIGAKIAASTAPPRRADAGPG